VGAVASMAIPERYNASTLLDGNLEAGRGNNVAICCGDLEITYAELLERACCSAGVMRDLGVARGDRVLMVLDDIPSFPAIFLGAMRIGSVPVPVNPLCEADEYRYFAEDSGAKVVVVDAARAEKVRAAVGGLISKERLLSAEAPIDDIGALADLANGQPRDIPPADTHRDDVAFWLYSSGSTGRPKGVVHLHHDMIYTCMAYAQNVLGITETDRTFSTTKLFHAYGLGNNLSFPYSAGASTILLSGRPAPEAVFPIVRRFRPTIFFSVPTLYNAMLNAPHRGEQDFSSVRVCVSAAEPLPAEVWHRWNNAHNVSILDGVGSTEMLHIYCSNTLDDIAPGSSGRPVPGYVLKLVNDDGLEILDPGTGDLHVRGDSALDSYWNQPERTADTLRDGWFYTRDRYRRDQEGRYWYEGRADDMFKVSGLWVSPARVEGVLMEHPAVVEAAVVGASVGGLTKAKAFLTLRDPGAAGEALEQQLKDFCTGKLHSYEVPQFIAVVDDLPKTVTGKIQRFLLRERS
jgi:benzoate-CoA ligase family protein